MVYLALQPPVIGLKAVETTPNLHAFRPPATFLFTRASAFSELRPPLVKPWPIVTGGVTVVAVERSPFRPVRRLWRHVWR